MHPGPLRSIKGNHTVHPSPAFAMPKLIVCRDGRDYRIVEFADELTIGRDPDNTIVLDSPQVSRRHAALSRNRDGDLVLADLDSTNGTWLGRERVRRSTLLRSGQSFRIMAYSLTLVDESGVHGPTRIVAGTGPDQRREQAAREGQTILFDLADGPESVDRQHAGTTTGPAALLPIFARLRRIDDEEELLAALLQHALDLCGAAFGFVALKDEHAGLVYRQVLHMDAGQERGIREEIIRQVMDSGVGRSDTGSHQGSGVVCVPLFIGQGPATGCLYCGTDKGEALAAEGCLLLELLADHVALLLANLRQRSRLAMEEQGLRSRLADREQTVVHSPAMLKLYRDIRTIAPIRVPVLILGEAGSGKELVAAALHSFSGRKGAWVTLNCSAIPEGIFESELFGSVRGAFHDAMDKPGKLEQAHGGTLFLDEIGDMALSLQPKLLRFLENNEVTRLGDTRTRRLDVRIVAATNQDLEAMIREKKFRDDFYQRLSCFILKVPPLRERREDIEPLVHHFLARFADEFNWPEPQVAPAAMRTLVDYTWPGNVRQLRNVVLRLSVQCRGRRITVHDLCEIQDDLGQARQRRVAAFPSLAEMERHHIREALERSAGNMSDCARMLGIARSTLYQKMKKYGLGIS